MHTPRFIRFLSYPNKTQMAIPLERVWHLLEREDVVSKMAVCDVYTSADNTPEFSAFGSLEDILDAIRFSDGVIIDARFNIGDDHAEG